MLMKTCTQHLSVQLHDPAHSVMCVNFLHFIKTPSWVLGCTVVQVDSSLSARQPQHVLHTHSHMQTHIDCPIIRVQITDADMGGEEGKRWMGRKRMRKEKMDSGGRIFRSIISTTDGQILEQRNKMKIRRLIWDFIFTKICKNVTYQRRL